ncbi:DUF305 domain-containing protein [Caulobacter sp. CCUG 60055]|uniref:DUF4142 domain-containing protein n=1 Tax=Caulobacter sp. CCUG 60055 TaxID=2100090 RepID=UPI001FA70282|nr:DUF4142 domain-containing protein [Caulobacter sp. CCUG 60055]MCI3179622.1 DUF305 domain-containing protein [Caulobacter sp. CCUG 60055]
MKHAVLIAGVGVLALSLAACGKKAETSNPADGGAPQAAQQPDANPAATIPTPSNEAAAPDFVAKAAAGDLYEIQASKIALTRANNAEVKKFARMMIDAHVKTTEGLKKAIAASGQAITLPAALPDDLQGKVDELNKADAKAFDKVYVDGQVDAHQAALNLFQRYANDGTVAQLKSFAAETAPTIQNHLSLAKGLKDGLK